MKRTDRFGSQRCVREYRVHTLPATWSPEDLQLGISGIVSLLLTTAGMLITRTMHAPACATTLIVSLGLMPTFTDSGIILLAVLSLYGSHRIFVVVVGPAGGKHPS